MTGIIGLTLISFAIASSIIGTMYIFGFFHDSANTAPSVGINPDVQKQFDELYSHHPNIQQHHIQNAYDQLVNDCVDHVNAESIERDGEPSMTANFVCTAMNSGMIQGYLEDLGYAFIDPTPYMQAPQLIN